MLEGDLLPPEVRRLEKTIYYVNDHLRLKLVVNLGRKGRNGSTLPGVKARRWTGRESRGNFTVEVNSREYLVFECVKTERGDGSGRLGEEFYASYQQIPEIGDALQWATDAMDEEGVFSQDRKSGRWEEGPLCRKHAYKAGLSSGKTLTVSPCVFAREDVEGSETFRGVGMFFSAEAYVPLSKRTSSSLVAFLGRFDLLTSALHLVSIATTAALAAPRTPVPRRTPGGLMAILKTMSAEEMSDYCAKELGLAIDLDVFGSPKEMREAVVREFRSKGLLEEG